jgi:aspartate aminotransferase
VLADDRALVDYFLDEARVAMTPGSGFGAPGFARLSYTVSLSRLDVAFERLAAALARLERE